MSSPSANPWLSQQLGDPPRYRLDQPIGSGAFGDVFLAMDLRLGRRVAVKILKGEMMIYSDLLIRFEREIALLLALESEHIVQVIDYGVTIDKHPFYVMEYLQGQTLNQLLRQQRTLSIEQTLAIMMQLCAGLNIAHSGVTLWKQEATVAEPIKIIHRDLKPANIFLIPTPLGELVKILDFGIAKKLYVLQPDRPTQITQTFLGTFRYSAPEQLKNAREIDERADIYSLGMIFYEMLSGTDPFEISTQVSARRLEQAWAMAHAVKPPIPLCQQPSCEQIPSALEAAVMRCLAKCPSDRLTSVAELSSLLHGIKAAAVSPIAPIAPTQLEIPRSERQDTTICRPIAQYVEAQSAAEQTLYQPKRPAQISPDPNSLENTVRESGESDPAIREPHPEPQTTGTLSGIDRSFPPDATIVQIVSSANPHPTPNTSPQSERTSQDATMMQGTPHRANKSSQPARRPGRGQTDQAGLLEQAKAWLQSSASNYGDRIRAQASAEVRHTAYSLLARLLPAGIGFAFGLASLSGAYFLLRRHAPNLPSIQIPTRVK